MRYEIEIRGISPLIPNCGTKGLILDSPENLEKTQITKKKGGNKTEADLVRLRQLETAICLWEKDDGSGTPTIPTSALRSVIERGARKVKQGPQVREGLIVEESTFTYDSSLGRNVQELSVNPKVHFTVAVVQSRARILKTRPKFDEWGCTFVVEVDPELVDQYQLENWLDLAGRRIGLGDWRPDKSGHFGRFETLAIKQI